MGFLIVSICLCEFLFLCLISVVSDVDLFVFVLFINRIRLCLVIIIFFNICGRFKLLVFGIWVMMWWIIMFVWLCC